MQGPTAQLMSTRPTTVRVRNFSKHLAVTATFSFSWVRCLVLLPSVGPIEVESSLAVDAASGSMGLESGFSVGEGFPNHSLQHTCEED
jgi:hypothetical protein